MSISVGTNSGQLNLTHLGAGTVGGIVGVAVASKVSKTEAAKNIATGLGAVVGGQLEKIPTVGGAMLGAAASRNLGGGDVASALAAHAGGRGADALPKAGELLDDVATGGPNKAARGAAHVGKFVVDEVPNAVGAVAGSKMLNGLRKGLPGLGAIGGAVAGIAVVGALPFIPQATWSFGTAK